MNIYTPGQVAIISGTFLDPIAKTGLTPTTLKLRVINPAGVETDQTTFSNPSPGTYTANVLLPTAGVWKYRWEATGAAFTAASEGSLTVSATTFAPD